MKVQHKQQAEQLYRALLKREQTWTRNAATLSDWANEFEQLESDTGSPKRIQRVLDWYCQHGCGALFVPMIGHAEAFRSKFEQLDAARKRLKGQQLRYFDDLLDYEINERTTGSTAQKQCCRVMQRVQQQVEFIDDLAHGRAKLPKAKAAARNGHTMNGHTSSAKPLTKTEKKMLAQYVIVNKDVIWQLLMDNPKNQEKWHERLESSGFNRRLSKYVRTLHEAPF